MDKLINKDSKEIIEQLRQYNERFAGKTVFLTGAAGFLGAQFVHYFAELNDSNILSKPVRLIAMDNFSRGKPDWMVAFMHRSDIDVMQADITEPLAIEGHFDFIVHAASIASPTYYRRFPIETMDANVLGLRQLLDFAVEHPPESMLFFSSSEVYGDPLPQNIPTPETYSGNVSCDGPRSCYDESKRYGETLCVNFHRVHKVPVRIVRPFNNYGPGLKITDGRVISDFFRNVIANHDIVMYSDGNPTRTFCYISDAITGYLLALLCPVAGEVFNIGTNKPEISMREFAEIIIQASGKSLQVVCRSSNDPVYLKDNPNRRCPDISKARQVLNYRPKVGLEEGLSRLYQWYIANPEAKEG